jgi:hypothetical protein
MTRLRRLIIPAFLASVSLRPEAIAQNDRPPSDRVRINGEALQGPLSPPILSAIVGLDDEQLMRYRTAYRQHMGLTWDARWGVVSAVRLLEQAFESRNQDAVRHYYAVIDRLWYQVSALDRSFELGLESFLREGQRQRYREWREGWERAVDILHRIEGRDVPSQPPFPTDKPRFLYPVHSLLFSGP